MIGTTDDYKITLHRKAVLDLLAKDDVPGIKKYIKDNGIEIEKLKLVTKDLARIKGKIK